MAEQGDVEARQIGVRLSGSLHARVVEKQRELESRVPLGVVVTISTTVKHLIMEGLEAVRERELHSKESV